MSDFLDFGDIEVKPKFKEKYKGVSGEKHRAAIIWPKLKDDAKGSGPFVMKKTHYADKYFICKDGFCCEKLGPSKTRFACLIVKYPHAELYRSIGGEPFLYVQEDLQAIVIAFDSLI